MSARERERETTSKRDLASRTETQNKFQRDIQNVQPSVRVGCVPYKDIHGNSRVHSYMQ